MESDISAEARPKAGPVEHVKPVRKRLDLRLRESDRPDEDIHLLEDVRGLLLEHQGEDEVSLEVAIDGSIVKLEWSLLRVKVCPELQEALRRLLGDAGDVTVVEQDTAGTK